ncbi:UNVERIFIED_CONTAM: movement protein [Sesamum angustifolium]|uniref:Movement protein n=1 Tax=Sesamum angustifolium TaxID=2727405 RepID=A0AAW2JGV9_9LAMI
MEFTGNVMEMQLIPKEEILEELSRLREEIIVTMKWIHIGTIEVVIKATFKEGIDSEIPLSIMDRRINNVRDGCLGTMIGNLYAGKLMFDIHHRIAYNLVDQDFSRALTLHQDFKSKDLMKEEYIEIPRIFKEFAKVMAPDPIRIPRISGVNIVIKDHLVLDRTISSKTEFSSRMSFSEDRIMGYKGNEKELLKVLTPQEIRQPVVGRYEGMLEIAGQEILVTDVVGGENRSMTLGLSFLEDHKPWGRKRNAYIDLGSGICTAKPGVSLKKQGKPYLLLQEGIFHKKILILNTGIREAKIMIGGAFGMPWFRMNMEDKKDMQMIIKEHINLGLIEPGISAYSSPGFLIKMESESKKFTAFSTPQGQYIWNLLPMGLANAPQVLSCSIVEKIHNFLDILKDKKHLKSFLGVVNFADANDYRWAIVLMKKTTTGEEPCRYIGGTFIEQQAQVWHLNEKEFFAVWKAFKKWPLFLLAKEFTLKVDNTNVKLS